MHIKGYRLAGRRRRTAEESRSLILQVAASRLREQGLDGLNITGVAEDAGISHATLIHHFGSSVGMREALAAKMTLDLVEDLMNAFDDHIPTTELTRNVFTALAEGGHAKLVAWRAVEGRRSQSGKAQTDQVPERTGGDEEAFDEIRTLFGQLLQTTQSALGVDDRAEVQKAIYLVAIAAIGYGVAGEVLANVLGMSQEDLGQFPEWLTEHIQFHG